MEKFLEFVDISHRTGEKIAETILQFYKYKGLEFKLLGSQCYDGTANMSSEKGVAAMICSHSPTSPYTHCHSHGVLKLSIANLFKKIYVQHIIHVATMYDISIFFKHLPLREKLLEDVDEKLSVHPSTRNVLTCMLKTHLAERDSCYVHFC